MTPNNQERQIPAEVKQKIEEDALKYADYYLPGQIRKTIHNTYVKGAAHYFDEGYSLSSQELEESRKELARLRELIEKAHKEGYPDHVTDKWKEDMWKQFKKQNNL